ncbi:protein disulfide-isomerase ERp60 [Capsaspora owczarzaki ATCC 30864]|uniref:Protein disulfide-isomerase n=1 Tax=Capsaspora owczarzaki (strain ATCC 30864) TaxID=595528 RepID=A0A0D2U2W7_CAPO3|nr:protein disulfide-isomerase ERp60 [Capsaspora owczarzaki ATCC 30864]KJE89521.1 protein disulfide-isomerase ERp60 [Capsaspora owczarzaki ATCC 30864]|eukprot:XP_004365843.1 protein disulfide-isomerase ERp60 [Capsaspora owczarzaki ATCC 30864]
MRFAALFALLALCAVASASDVLVLTTDNFRSTVDAHDALLVEFYAPWCGHCKRLEPEYDKAAAILAKDDPPIYIAKVDATEEPSLASDFGVSGYPTIKLFRKGAVSGDYDSGRDANSIVAYMRKQSGPSARTLSTVEEAKNFVAKNDISVIGFFPAVGSMQEVFLKTADQKRDAFRFAVTSSKEVAAAFNIEGNKVVLFHAPHYESKLEGAVVVPYEGASSQTAFESFLAENATPLVGVYSDLSKARFDLRKARGDLPLIVTHFKVDYANNAKNTNYWRNRVLAVAKKFIGKAHFAIASKEEFAARLSEFGLQNQELAVAFEHKGKKYAMNEDFSVANLEKFVEDFLGGNIKPHVKSEPVPKVATDVKVLVGSNFDDEVFGNDKDMLIEFYAPWCGHCKSLEPVFNELAQKVKGEENLIIAKLDATSNDFARDLFPVSGYPTLYWVPGNNKHSPKKYEGGRDVKSFIDYIKKESTYPLKLKKSKGEL